MALTILALLLHFILSLAVSSVIIYFVTKLFGQSEGFGTAIKAAFIGALIYVIAYFLLGTGLLAAVIGGIAWLIALGSFYGIGWLKSALVAFVIWIFAAIIGVFLPTLTGPL